MIHVTIYKTKTHEYAGFDVEGHAGFAESGQDIVCAAVSMLVINTINSIEQLVSDEYTLTSDEEDGVIQFRLSNLSTHDTQLLLRSMILGLESLEDNSEYEPYIDIIFKEV